MTTNCKQVNKYRHINTREGEKLSILCLKENKSTGLLEKKLFIKSPNIVLVFKNSTGQDLIMILAAGVCAAKDQNEH